MTRTAVWIFVGMTGVAAWVALIVEEDSSGSADEAQVSTMLASPIDLR